MLQRAGLQSKVKALTNSNLIDSGYPVFWHPELLKALPITNLVLRPHPRTHTRKERSKGRCVRRWRCCLGAVSTLACRGRNPTRSGGRARAERPEGGKAARHRLTPADRAAKSGRENRQRTGRRIQEGRSTSGQGGEVRKGDPPSEGAAKTGRESRQRTGRRSQEGKSAIGRGC